MEHRMPPLAGLVSPSAIAHGIGQSLKLARAANSRGGASIAPFDDHLQSLDRTSQGNNAAATIASEPASLDQQRVEHQTAMAEFEERFRRLLRERGIDLQAGVTLDTDRDGQVAVVGDHPQKQAIEQLFHDEPELKALFARLDRQASDLRAADLAAELTRLEAEAPGNGTALVQELLHSAPPHFSLVVAPAEMSVRFS
jgi:pyruvate/2-oxoglutarate dehydrogenase complex dihydrolipoamide acyltransferase (E2) component